MRRQAAAGKSGDRSPHSKETNETLGRILKTRQRRQEPHPRSHRRRNQRTPAVPERGSLIDVREDNEWEAGHAAGSSHLGKGIIERDSETEVPDKATEVILYCGGGYRSALAADVLQHMGYTNVFSMAGGWKAWRDSGAPITKD